MTKKKKSNVGMRSVECDQCHTKSGFKLLSSQEYECVRCGSIYSLEEFNILEMNQGAPAVNMPGSARVNPSGPWRPTYGGKPCACCKDSLTTANHPTLCPDCVVSDCAISGRKPCRKFKGAPKGGNVDFSRYIGQRQNPAKRKRLVKKVTGPYGDVKVYYDSLLGEYAVVQPGMESLDASTYFTMDKTDALSTAKTIAKGDTYSAKRSKRQNPKVRKIKGSWKVKQNKKRVDDLLADLAYWQERLVKSRGADSEAQSAINNLRVVLGWEGHGDLTAHELREGYVPRTKLEEDLEEYNLQQREAKVIDTDTLRARARQKASRKNPSQKMRTPGKRPSAYGTKIFCKPCSESMQMIDYQGQKGWGCMSCSTFFACPNACEKCGKYQATLYSDGVNACCTSCCFG